MITEKDVFRKIKEISTRGYVPRPLVNAGELASELGTSSEIIRPCLAQLKQMRLVNFNDTQGTTVKLTLLGTVVNR